jgi:GxxExxY protein
MHTTPLLHEDETYRLRGACFEVYRDKGCGFHEAVYHECMKIELRLQSIPAVSKPRLELEYKGEPLEQTYEPDFVCFNEIILELKAVPQILPDHRAQVMNYLKASKFRLGLIANFGHYPKIEIERIVANDKWQAASEPDEIDLHA